MIHSMSNRRGNAGFTLIDAMIAIVVLATGILALTLLQTTMVRATAEARDRSEAITVGQNLIEEARASSTQTMAGYSALVDQGTWNGSGNCDFDATTFTRANLTGEDSAGAALSDESYRYCLDVTRYQQSGSVFQDISAVSPQPAYVGTTPEFKQIELQIGWKKPDGSWGSMTLGDAVSGIPLENSKELENRPLGGNSLSGPPVVQYPGNYLASEDNFIPIAVGDSDGTQIAATNPTPEVTGGGVSETSFQVFTYLSQTNAIQVQRQIDTKVVACSCSLEQASADPSSFEDFSLRPSYWDGRRYTAPENVDNAQEGVNQETYKRGAWTESASESAYCDVCCRDHHDPAGFDYNGEDSSDPSDDNPKYDVFAIDPTSGVRIASHRHYANAQLPAITTNGQQYDEVCRLVRVDGVYRVTPDPAVEHFAFLPTDNGTRDRTTSSISSNYNSFVRDYVEDRLLPLSGYDATDSMPVAATPPVNVASLENTYGLNAQAASAITVSTEEASPIRYLQDRAVVLDALEYDAQQMIEQQLESDPSCATDPLPCILAVVPFSSINLTALTNWSTDPEGIFTIRAQDVKDDQGDVEAYAGQVGLVASPTGTGTGASVVGKLSRTLAGLVDRFELFPLADATAQAAWRHGDTQAFERTNAAPTGARFRVVPSGLTYFNQKTFGSEDAPDVRWFSGSSQGVCIFSQEDKDFTCHVFDPTLMANMSIRITNYHGVLEVDTNGNDADGIKCPTGANKPDAPPAKCSIFASSLASVTPAALGFALTPTTPTANPSDDTITINLGAVTNGMSYTVAFSGGTAVTPGGQCNETSGVVTWDWSACRTN